MWNKREYIARLFPAGVPFSETINASARFARFRRKHFSACPELAERDALYEHVAKSVQEPISYLEFGVWQGASIARWALLNRFPDSRFYGFDSFEGLPEDYDRDHAKGAFSTGGQAPKIADPRVSFVKGLFQDTLRDFLKTTSLDHRLVVNVDCDLYSATLFVLGTLDRLVAPGTIMIFDDFHSMNQEFKAFCDYDLSFGRQWRALGKLRYCTRVAIEFTK